MARVADQGFSLRRPREFFVPTGQTAWKPQLISSHRPTSQRMADIEGGNPQSTSRQPDRRKLHALLPEPGPDHSRPHRKVPKMQSVSFDHRVTVYPANDYDRKSPWMYDFRQRIQQTELILAPILDDKSYTIRMRRCVT